MEGRVSTRQRTWGSVFLRGHWRGTSYAQNGTKSALQWLLLCMTPPSESSSGHIDMFRVRQKPPELPDRSFPAVYVVPRYSVPRYHSMQLALVIGLFACGGLVCSTFFVVENDDFMGPRYWPRKSYSSPALATPHRPVSAPTVPQNGQFKSDDEEKTAALQEHRVGDRKTPTSPLSLASAAQNSVLRR
jgi:hypothetical protein